jgi:hypothetical protein
VCLFYKKENGEWRVAMKMDTGQVSGKPVRALLIQGRGPNFATANESFMSRAEDPAKRKTVFFGVTILEGPYQGEMAELDVRINSLTRIDSTPDILDGLCGVVTSSRCGKSGQKKSMACRTIYIDDYDCVKKTAGIVLLYI